MRFAYHQLIVRGLGFLAGIGVVDECESLDTIGMKPKILDCVGLRIGCHRDDRRGGTSSNSSGCYVEILAMDCCNSVQ